MNHSRRFAFCTVLLAAVVALASGVARAADDAAAKEKQLLETLRSAAPPEKAVACKELAIYGTKNAVPELANLLANEQLASWARIALEAIPDPAAGAALRKEAESLDGLLLIGAINSIGVRRDAAAVELLTSRLKDANGDVAAAAAVALGRIANDAATASLRQALADAPPTVRTAVAEGCILCAERLLAEGKSQEAAEIYDEVRRAEVPQQRIVEATRGAILAGRSQGIHLLVELLHSPDKRMFQLGLTVAREKPGRGVVPMLEAELSRLAPERAALLLSAIADRGDSLLSATVIEASKGGDKQVRLAAIDVVGLLGNAAHVTTLLEIAAEEDAEISQAAKAALAGLPGENLNVDLVDRLATSEGKTLAALIEVVGKRRIEATAALVKAAEHSDESIRTAALTALGETVGPNDLSVLIEKFVAAKSPQDAEATGRALQAAAIRMPDREATAAELAAAMPQASTATKASLLKILGAMGGPKALETIAAAVKGGDAELQDAGTRVLGEWMTVDAGPVLLDLAKDPANSKYQVRALRGYLRLARQFVMPDAERAEMCQKALEAATRLDEQKLVLEVLERYPSIETLKVAVQAAQTPALREDATRVAQAIAKQLGGKAAEVQPLLLQLGSN